MAAIRGSPIQPYLKRILTTISQKDVSSVISPDGAGSTLAIPLAIANTGSKVLVCVPRKLKKMAQEKLLKESSPTISEMVVYLTPDETIDLILDGNILDFDVIMLDSIERDNMEEMVVAYLWNNEVSKGLKAPRLVLSGSSMSSIIYRASINSETNNTSLVDVSNYVIDMSNYSVNVLYHRRSFDLPRSSWRQAESKRFLSISEDILDVILELESTISLGNIMVYLPSDTHVDSLKNRLSGLTKTHISTGNTEESKTIFLVTSDTSKMVVSDIKIVIDSLLYKSSTGSIENIKKREADKRLLRAGINSQGVCYRMCTEEEYNNLFNGRYKQDIIKDLMFLSSKEIGFDCLLNYGSPHEISKGVRLLLRLGVLSKRSLTDKGYFVKDCPLSARCSSVLWDWIEEGYKAYPCVVLMSLIESYSSSFFVYPLKDLDQGISDYQVSIAEHRVQNFLRFKGKSDLDTLCNVWNVLTSEVEDLTSEEDISRWCFENYIGYSDISNTLTKIDLCVEFLILKGIDSTISSFQTRELIDLIRPMVISSYSDKLLNRLEGSTVRISYSKEDGHEIFLLDKKRSVSDMSIDPPNKIVDISSFNLRSKNVSIISLALDVD